MNKKEKPQCEKNNRMDKDENSILVLPIVQMQKIYEFTRKAF